MSYSCLGDLKSTLRHIAITSEMCPPLCILLAQLEASVVLHQLNFTASTSDYKDTMNT